MALARPAAGLIANRSGSGLTGLDCLKRKARRGMDDERGPRAWVVREQREHGSSLIYGRRGEAYARRWSLRAVFNCRLGLQEPYYVRAKNLKWSNGDT